MNQRNATTILSRLLFAGASFLPSIALAGAGGSSGGGGGSSGGGGGGGQTGGPPGMGVDFPPLAFLLGGVMMSVGIQHVMSDKERLLKTMAAAARWTNRGALMMLAVAFFLAVQAAPVSFFSIESLTPFAILGVAALLARELKHEADTVSSSVLFTVSTFSLALAYCGYTSLLLIAAPLLFALTAYVLGGRTLLHRGALLWASGMIPALLLLLNRHEADVFLGEVTASVSTAMIGALGLQVTAVGQTIHGLAIPVHVTTLCAGLHIIAGAALISAIVCTTFLRRSEFGQLRYVGAFILLSIMVNVLRVVTLSLIIETHSADAAIASHDLVGYVFSALLYVALAVSVVRAKRKTLRSMNPPRVAV